MRRARLLLVGLIAVLGCGARTDLGGPSGARVDGTGDPAVCDEGSGAPREAPPCEGSGLILTVGDECLDDGGSSDQNDVLEVYCVSNVARFCLSNEQCPWRAGATPSDDMTCSPSGLMSAYMANVRRGCMGFEGHEYYCCSADGRISFAGR